MKVTVTWPPVQVTVAPAGDVTTEAVGELEQSNSHAAFPGGLGLTGAGSVKVIDVNGPSGPTIVHCRARLLLLLP